MSRESEANVAQISDADVFAAIKYLDPDARGRNPDAGRRSGSDHRTGLAIRISLLFVLISCIAIIWLYQSMF
jgi:hypothetical protein